jgi:hypothetical protein
MSPTTSPSLRVLRLAYRLAAALASDIGSGAMAQIARESPNFRDDELREAFALATEMQIGGRA